MTVDLNDLEIGDYVRFVDGQIAKVVDIRDNGRLYFNKKVACDVGGLKSFDYDSNWYYDNNGECNGCTNHITEIIKKGEKTMNKHKIEKSLEWHKKKVAELEEALKQPEHKRWFPKKDEKYYGIRNNHVEDYHNHSEKCTEDMYSINNVFKTREEAEKELARRKAETELLDMCDWTSDCDRMWMIYYDRGTSNFDIDYFCAHQFSQCCFASIESAQKAIDTLGVEKLKLIFRID